MPPTSMIEKVILENFIRTGWNVECEPRMRVPLSDRQFFIPDIALFDENKKLFGIVEMFAQRQDLYPKRIDAIEHLIKSAPVQVCIITNGHAYDIYIKGRLATQTVICPSLETCQYLLRSSVFPTEEGET